MAQQKYFKEDPLLTPEEKRWLALEPHPQQYLLTPQEANSEWRKREPDDIFQTWWKSQKLTTIFFDGASKGNPGAAGAGGAIYSSNGTLSDSFCWGLGLKTNNQAETLELLKACLIARGKGIKAIQVFGDSEILIKKLIKDDLFNNVDLNKFLGRLKRVISDFDSCKFYHILRDSNSVADRMANKGCSHERDAYCKWD